MRSIAIMNQKGGVGKTTTAVNLSAALAESGQRVCLIDLDPQAHASLHLGVTLRDGQPSVYDVLTSDALFQQIRRPITDKLSLVPAHLDLAAAEVELAGEVGREVGTNTGRARRCGWFDAVLVRQSIALCGADGIALTKLDVARGRGPLKVCVGYRLDGATLDEPPGDADELERAEPEYIELEGWEGESREARRIDDLPAAARTYISTLERLTGVPMWLVSVGAERAETIRLHDPFGG